MALVLEKKQISNFLEELGKKFKVVDIRESILPVKQYFLPVREEIFSFNKKTGRLSKSKPQKNLLIFGLSLADLEAVTQLDEIMRRPKPDFFYFQKRSQATLIGLTEESVCMPPVCVPPGGDLILEKINPEQYRVWILTARGQKIAKNKFLKSVKAPPIKNYFAKSVPMQKLKEMLLDPEHLADALSWSWENDQKIWQELAELCLGCGICSYLCPLCYCFFMEDRVNLDEKECSRSRIWDACTLPDFSKIAGGYNFHKTLKERYYNWFYHKFVRAYKEYGKSLCCACGRCKKYCPAKIDIETWLIKIVDNYEKHLLAPKS